MGCLLPELIADCKRLLPAGFIFQQDGAPAHTAFLAQFKLSKLLKFGSI